MIRAAFLISTWWFCTSGFPFFYHPRKGTNSKKDTHVPNKQISLGLEPGTNFHCEPDELQIVQRMSHASLWLKLGSKAHCSRRLGRKICMYLHVFKRAQHFLGVVCERFHPGRLVNCRSFWPDGAERRKTLLGGSCGEARGVDSPFFSAIVLVKNRIHFPGVFAGFLERFGSLERMDMEVTPREAVMLTDNEATHRGRQSSYGQGLPEAPKAVDG